jgi:EpsI family protein
MNLRIALVTVTLVLSFALRGWLSAAADPPHRENLANFPQDAGTWTMVSEEVLDEETAGVLKADDYVVRRYESAGQPVDLFVAYYQTQKAGESMHSPKNCLPGAGWEITSTQQVALLEDSADPLMINKYVIEKNGQKVWMLYWYQASGRVIASEYWGKVYLVLDALRTGRRDGGIVRLTIPIRRNSDGSEELKVGLDMARTVMPLLSKYLPG